MPETLVRFENVEKRFVLPRRWGELKRTVAAVASVSFSIQSGEIFGLAGESGCGKSTLGRLLLRLLPTTSGQIYFANQDITTLSEVAMQPLRRQMQIIFQDPYSSLNPRMTVGSILGEALKIHRLVERKQRLSRIHHLLETVGLNQNAVNKYPHEFSGGQRQRIGIARALAVQPRLVVADEPVSALDVSIQAQIITLLQQLQKSHGLTYLFISHDLELLEFICDRLGVMYLGEIMEILPATKLSNRAKHPYTKALLQAIPDPNPAMANQVTILEGDTSQSDGQGCVFHHRCPMVQMSCRLQKPKLRQIAPDHWLACDLVATKLDEAPTFQAS